MSSARPPEEAREGPVSPEFPMLAVETVWRCLRDSRGMGLPDSKPCSLHASVQDATGEEKPRQCPPGVAARVGYSLLLTLSWFEPTRYLGLVGHGNA